MSMGIVPLRRRDKAQSALARVDVVAVGLLASGRETTLHTARAAVILTDLQEQRDQLDAVLADLREREPSNDTQINEVNANLVTAVCQGIDRIEHFIAQARAIVELAPALQREPIKPQH